MLSFNENKNLSVLKIMNVVLILHLVWSVARNFIHLPGLWNGVGIFFFPLIEVFLIIYCYFRTQLRLIMPYVLLPIIFNIYMIIRHCFSGDIMSHGASDCYTFFFSLFCLISISKEDFIERFYLFCLAAFILAIIISLSSYLSLVMPLGVEPLLNGRLQGFLHNPNNLAHVVTYGFVLGVGSLLIKPEKKPLLIALIFEAFLTVKILLDTESRAAMLFLGIVILGMIIGFFAWFHKALPQKMSKFIFGLIIIVLIAIILFFILFIVSDGVRSFFLDLLRIPYDENSDLLEILKSTIASFNSASGRDILRATAIRYWKTNLLFGLSIQEIFVDSLAENNRPIDSHNSFIQIGATLGIIGLFLFALMYVLSFIFSIASSVKSTDNKIKTISVFTMIFLVALFVDVNFENFIYMSLGMMALVGYFVICAGLQLGKLLTDEKVRKA